MSARRSDIGRAGNPLPHPEDETSRCRSRQGLRDPLCMRRGGRLVVMGGGGRGEGGCEVPMGCQIGLGGELYLK